MPNYPTSIPDAYTKHEDLESAYRKGWNFAHGIACHNVPSIGDRISLDVDYVGLGERVDAENIREYHQLLCHAGADNSRQYSPFECTASEFNKHPAEPEEDDDTPTSEEMWEAFEAGTSDAISADLEGYTDEDYGIEPENETEEEESEILLPENIVADFEGRAAAERAGGGSIEINHRIPTVAVKLSDGSEFFFQEREAGELIDSTPANISAEDYILALAQGW